MGALQVAAEDRDGILILKIIGDMDIHGVPQVEEVFKEHYDKGADKVVFDLSGMGYTSSAGIGVFMGITQRVKARGGDVKIAAVQDRVNRTFTMTGVTKVFSICDTVEDAVGSF